MRDRATETAAASAVSTDLMANHRQATRGFPRGLQAVALTGSAAAGDAGVEIYIGDTYAGRVTNQRTGSEVLDVVDWMPIGKVVPPGELIQARIVDAGATNVLVFHFITQP